jgi:hypothetical protein
MENQSIFFVAGRLTRAADRARNAGDFAQEQRLLRAAAKVRAGMALAEAEVLEHDLLFGPKDKVVHRLSALAAAGEYDTPAPAPTPDPEPDPTPDPQPDPTPDPQPDPTPDPQPDPTPDPQPDPTPDPQPDPTPDPQPDPTPDSQPDPTPDPQPDPTPDPQPDPTPDPQPDPIPDPQPDPTPDPQSGPTPDPQPDPTPDPQPDPTPDPQPGPTPDPQPDPPPDPQSGPTPDPQPGPTPDPQPDPPPNPQPDPPPNPQPDPTPDSGSDGSGDNSDGDSEDDQVDMSFLSQSEGQQQTKAYVPEATTSKSGVTVGTGVDLGQLSQQQLANMPIPQDLKDQLQPYVGLKQTAAQQYLTAHPLTITEPQAQALDDVVIGTLIQSVGQKYQAASGQAFTSLPPEAQTVIADVAMQYGSNLGAQTAAPTFWKAVTTGQWQDALAELQDFKDGPSYKGRHDKQAALLQTAIQRGAFTKPAP